MARKLVVSVAAFVLIATVAQAQQKRALYVSPGGNDADLGTAERPLKTLQRAADLIMLDARQHDGCAAGDTVIVRAGTYAEGFVLGWDEAAFGSLAAPIIFKADPDAPAGSVVITGRNGKSPDGINIEAGCHFVVIDGFTINNAAETIRRAGIRVAGSSHATITHNACDRCGSWGIYCSHADDVLIQGNTASNAVKEHGIYVSNSSRSPIVRGNHVFGNAHCGVHLNGDASQKDSGLIIGAVIECNVIHDNGAKGGSAINCDGVQKSRIQNNLLYRNHASGISLFRDDGAGGSSGNVIVNNTIVMAVDGRWAVNIRNGSTGNQIVNNILLNANRAHGSINISADSVAGWLSDHNIVDRFSIDDGRTLLDLAGWRARTAQDLQSAAGTVGDIFMDAGHDDYHPRHGGAAVGVGDGLIAPEKDLDGHSRGRAERADAGAYVAFPEKTIHAGRE